MTMAKRKRIDARKWSEKGISCPNCESRLSRTRLVRHGTATIWRLRECIHCGHVVKTAERVIDEDYRNMLGSD